MDEYTIRHRFGFKRELSMEAHSMNDCAEKFAEILGLVLIVRKAVTDDSGVQYLDVKMGDGREIIIFKRGD